MNDYVRPADQHHASCSPFQEIDFDPATPTAAAAKDKDDKASGPI
jgi:hypothetical protein